jgi:hypothetical protein
MKLMKCEDKTDSKMPNIMKLAVNKNLTNCLRIPPLQQIVSWNALKA